MIQKIYAIWDQKGKHYNQPFMELTHGSAERTFHQIVNDERSRINSYPDDFDLYYLGEFDNVKGTYSSPVSPEHIIKAVQVFDQNNQKREASQTTLNAVQ